MEGGGISPVPRVSAFGPRVEGGVLVGKGECFSAERYWVLTALGALQDHAVKVKAIPFHCSDLFLVLRRTRAAGRGGRSAEVAII